MCFDIPDVWMVSVFLDLKAVKTNVVFCDLSMYLSLTDLRTFQSSCTYELIKHPTAQQNANISQHNEGHAA